MLVMVKKRKPVKIDCTYVDKFAPVPPTPVIVQGGMPSARAHFSGHEDRAIDVAPFLFDRFSVRSSDSGEPVERVACPALEAMAREMPFGDEVAELNFFRELEIRVEFLHPFVEVN